MDTKYNYGIAYVQQTMSKWEIYRKRNEMNDNEKLKGPLNTIKYLRFMMKISQATRTELLSWKGNFFNN